jgi:hypothetical protein
MITEYPIVQGIPSQELSTTLPPNVEIVRAHGYIKKEKEHLYFITSSKRPFHIKIITKIDKCHLKQSRFLLKITNEIFFKINENKDLDNESYISIVRFGKLRKDKCGTTAINIWP